MGINWLNMACVMVYQRSLPTACADWLPLARHWTFVQLELIEKFGSGSDVKLTVFGVDHTEPLGLTNAELRFGDQLNYEFRVCF
jgi:hypothetical protein